MPRVIFAASLCRHVDCPPSDVEGGTVRELLDVVFRQHAALRSYVLDDQDRLRKHVNIFVNATLVADRVELSDPVPAGGEVYVMQALSGGT